MSEHPSPRPRPRPAPVVPWIRRTALPIPTLAVFGALALLLWVNVVANPYRFNVALALLATVPVAVLALRGAVEARHAGAAR